MVCTLGDSTVEGTFHAGRFVAGKVRYWVGRGPGEPNSGNLIALHPGTWKVERAA